MKIHGKVFLVILSLALTATAYAQEKPKVKPRLEPLAALKSFEAALALNRSNKAFFGPSLPCVAGQSCVANVYVIELFDRQRNLVSCLVQTGDIDLVYPHPGPTARTSIDWNLVPPVPSSPPTMATYKFERPHGLLIIEDIDQATGGKADVISDTNVELDHRFRRHRARVVFYPAVIQTLADGTTQSLCGAGDPRIAND